MLNWEIVRTLVSRLIAGFYWKAIFDPQDDLYKLVARFNQFAVQEIASQVSQISLLLERHHTETSSALEGISRASRTTSIKKLKRTHTKSDVASDLLEKMAAGKSHSNLAHGRDTYCNTIIPRRNRTS